MSILDKLDAVYWDPKTMLLNHCFYKDLKDASKPMTFKSVARFGEFRA